VGMFVSSKNTDYLFEINAYNSVEKYEKIFNTPRENRRYFPFIYSDIGINKLIPSN
jgi:hypothetical protein